MGIIIDVLILLFFFLCIRKNYRKKQLRCSLETGSTVLAMIFSVPLAEMCADLIYQKVFRNALAHNLAEVVSENASAESHSTAMARVMDEMPSVINNAAESYQTTIPANVEEIERILGSGSYSTAENITDIVAGPVIQGIFRAVFCLIFFFGLCYLIKSFSAIIENALYSPERAVQNTVLCAVLGCAKGLVIFTMIVAVIQLVLPALPHLPILNAETLSKSFLFRLFYHQNVLMLFLGKGIYPTTL